MARLFYKNNGQLLDAREIDEPYAHIFSNMTAFSLDGLGSARFIQIYTDPFGSTTGSILTNFVYGTGSYGHGGTLAGSLTINPITIGSVFDTIIPFVQGSFVNEYALKISFDGGATFNQYYNRELGSAVGVSGSGIVFRFEVGNANTGSDIIHGFGFYYG